GLSREERQPRGRHRDLPENDADGPAEHPAARQAGGPLLAGAPQDRRPQGVRGRRGPPARARRPRRVDPGLREGAADVAGQRRDPARVRPDSPGVGSCARGARGLAPGAGVDAAVCPAVSAFRRSGARRERRARCPGMALEGAVDRLFGRRSARARAQGPTGRRRDDVVVRGRGGSRRSGDAPGRAEKGAFDPGPARGGESRPGRRALARHPGRGGGRRHTDGDSLAVGPRRRPQVHGPHRGCRDRPARAASARAGLARVPHPARPARAFGRAPRRGPRRAPDEPAAPIPPPPSFAPAPPVAGAAEGEFILELEDDQLVHEPGSTGPVPNAVRRLSQPLMLSFPPSASAPLAPPRATLPPLEPLEPAREAEDSSFTPSLDEEVSGWSHAPRPAPRETDLEVETALPADEFQVPVEPAAFPPEAESIELSGEPLSAVEQPVPVPEPPSAEVLAPDATESALSEADVFRKYGLYDKAVDHLRGILKRAPDALPLREKLFELALEGGRKNVAIAEAERLKSLYRTEGRDDRVSAIDALLVERTSAEMGEASES